MGFFKSSLLILFAAMIAKAYDDDRCPVRENLGWTPTDKVILDMDAALSDIQGLLTMLKAYSLKQGPEIIAITITRRELHVDALSFNVARALRLAKLENIPFYLGSDTSLVVTPETAGRRFGNDALGDVPYDPTGLPQPRDDFGPDAIIKHVNEAEGKAVIVTTGALTNIALALKKDPKLLLKIRKIIVGAGAVRGRGNVQSGTEYKVWRDPEAMKIVLDNTNHKTAYLIANDGIWDVNEDTPTSFWMEIFFALKDPMVQFLKAASQVYWNGGALEGYALGDPVIVSTYLDPRIAKRCEPHNVTASTSCDSRGRLLGGITDFNNWRNDPNIANINVVSELSGKRYRSLLLKLFS